ncbi:MAG: tRNA (adenosine(37)-N6)-dimethylallyltransferase MiaA [Candidatus Paceibacterota bacterium]
MSKPKIIVIVGPTSSGKSALGVLLAEKFNGEIISADSRQVYTGLDLGTGKITAEEMSGIPHHLLDVTCPQNIFTASDFKTLADKAIKNILNKNKLPIIVGGTGFYIDTLLAKTNLPAVPPNEKLRQDLTQKSTSELGLKLKILDEDRFNNIDQYNRRRLIRAIEIAEALGQVPKITPTDSPFNYLMIGINIPQTELDQKIYHRLIERLNSGLIAEVKNLHQQGLTYKRLEDLGLEYKFIAYFLQNKFTKEEMIEKLHTAIRQYSKRQMTWLKKNSSIKWLNRKNLLQEASLLVGNFLND